MTAFPDAKTGFGCESHPGCVDCDSMTSVPVVAVVGRPNVGKSTLVNRIIGSRSAVVEEMPGVTRDRREFAAEWAGHGFLLVDTGGWEVDPSEDLVAAIREQAEAAVRAADAVLFVVDATTGISPDDAGVARLLHDSGTPVLLVANKVDDASREADVHHLWSLGVGQPYPVSALHGRGTGDLLDALVAALPEGPASGRIGRNAFAGDRGTPQCREVDAAQPAGRNRAGPGVTHGPGRPETRSTRSSIWTASAYRVVDTAGIRRQARIAESADHYAVLRARKALAESDVAVLLVDAHRRSDLPGPESRRGGGPGGRRVGGAPQQVGRRRPGGTADHRERGRGAARLRRRGRRCCAARREPGPGSAVFPLLWRPPGSTGRPGCRPDPLNRMVRVVAGGAPATDPAGEEGEDPLRDAGRGAPTHGPPLRLRRRALHRLSPIPGEPAAQGDRPDRHPGEGGGPEAGGERQAG